MSRLSDVRFYLRDALREWKAVLAISTLLGGLVYLGVWITSGKILGNKVMVGTISKFSMDDTRWSPGVILALVKTADGSVIMLTDPTTRFAGCKVGDSIRYQSIEKDNGHRTYRFERAGCLRT